MKKIFFIVTAILLLSIIGFVAFLSNKEKRNKPNETPKVDFGIELNEKEIMHPMSISVLQNTVYPGGEFVNEEELPNGVNYRQSVVSYQSEGLKIYGLLTVPLATQPEAGFPAVVFIHGYIPPRQYSTTGNYPTYQAILASAGFVTFKPDLRGHGNSEGEPVSAHFSEKYVIDTMNAISYLKMDITVDPERIGYWGHSNGGEIGLRVALISPDIKASSLWAGVVGSYEDMFETYIDKIPFLHDDENPLVKSLGLPSQNPEAWKDIEPYAHLANITIPIQLQHGTNDKSVPIELSQSLKAALELAGKSVEYVEYAGDDHNIGQNSSVAWQKTIDFYRKHL